MQHADARQAGKQNKRRFVWCHFFFLFGIKSFIYKTTRNFLSIDVFRPSFVSGLMKDIYVKTVAVVDNGHWGERWNARQGQHDNPGTMAAEQTKYRKHELAYSHIGFSFVAFICSCFGTLGPSANLLSVCISYVGIEAIRISSQSRRTRSIG